MATKNSPENFRRSLQEGFLDLLWRQWSTLGVASHGPEAVQPIDLEALVLATAVAAEWDRRLWTAALQWLVRCHEWANWARLQRMAAPFIQPDEWLKRPLIEADIWQKIRDVMAPAIFARAAGEKTSKTDRIITPPQLQKPPLLQIRLRGIFGINARAELFIFLLTRGEGNSNQIAREIHYDQKNVYLFLERWAEAGFVSREKNGTRNLYALKPGMKFTLPAEAPKTFWRWEPFFRVFGRLLVAVHNEPWRTDAYLLSSLFRSSFGDVSAFARTAGMALPEPQLHPGEALFAPMAEALPKITNFF